MALGPVVDVLTTAEGCVVLVEAPSAHRVVRVSEVGEAVLDALAAGPVGVTTLADALVERLGAPPGGDVRSVVSGVLTEMSHLGLVVVTS